MTKNWGPDGWKTLHSMALLYPDNPTADEKSRVMNWLEDFTTCIPCPQCQSHFRELTQAQKNRYDIFRSKHSFFWFSVVAHNTVNLRLSKPQIVSYNVAYDQYRFENWQSTRNRYYQYVFVQVNIERGIDAVPFLGAIRRMIEWERGPLFQKWKPQWIGQSDGIQAVLEETPLISIEIKPTQIAQTQPMTRGVLSRGLFAGSGLRIGW